MDDRDPDLVLYGEDLLPDDERLYEAIDPSFGDKRPDDPDDPTTTPVYELDATVLEELDGALEGAGEGTDAIGAMKGFYEYLAVEQDTLTRLSHEIYDHAARKRRQGGDIAVAGCDRDRDDVDPGIDPGEGGLLRTEQDVAADLERANRERERAVAETAREYVEDTDGTVAMVVGDGRLGYTGLKNRLRFDDIDMAVQRSGQDHHRRREELAGLLYVHTMRSDEAGEASRMFAGLLED